MRYLQITILLILTLIQNVNSQYKVIKGDTAFWYNRNQEFNKTLELTDFNTSQADFLFRFRNHGQIVEIFKTNNQIHGVLTNYIFHSIKKRSETLHQKIQIDSVKAVSTYEIIQKSGILDLQSDNKIKSWTGGYDGITYIVEHSDKNEYWYKTYWTPSAQDSIPESLIVMDFVKAISDTLQLPKKYEEFKDDLPPRGCYNSGGMLQTCYVNNSLGFGYYGSTKLPLGLSSSVYLNYIGKKYTDIGFGFQYKFDRNDNYDFGFNVSKGDLFIKNSKTNDFLFYNYQKRKLDFVDTNTTTFQNHIFNYALNFKDKFSLFTGLNYAIYDKEIFGGVFGITKWFNKPKFHTTLTASIFKDDIDYKIVVTKHINFNDKFIFRRTSIGLFYENFKDYNDLNIYLTLWL